MNTKEISNEELLDELCCANNKYVVGIEASPEYIETLSRLKAGEKAIKRYELVRKLSPSQFSDIILLNLRTGNPFDEIVDDLIPFYEKEN